MALTEAMKTRLAHAKGVPVEEIDTTALATAAVARQSIIDGLDAMGKSEHAPPPVTEQPMT